MRRRHQPAATASSLEHLRAGREPRECVDGQERVPSLSESGCGRGSSVPAEQGGKGFKGEGWQTNTDYDLIGDPRATRGGAYREYQLDFPSTLRLNGPEANTVLNSMIGSMAYETLLTLHPNSLDYMPALATHWQISPDKLTYRFRLDPNARWSDGEPVVADDVVATWALTMDKGLQDPMQVLVFGKFEKPVAESKYIVRVKSKDLNWRNFLYFSQALPILPSHILKDVDGARYVKEYSFKLLPGTGPYEVREAEVIKGKSLTIRRRNQLLGRQHPPERRAEQFRRNPRDRGPRPEAGRRDVQEGRPRFLHADRRANGWRTSASFGSAGPRGDSEAEDLQREPARNAGLAFNTRKPPFDDVRLRQAMAHLLNRPLIIEKLFYNEYQPIDSYFAGSPYRIRTIPRCSTIPRSR